MKYFVPLFLVSLQATANFSYKGEIGLRGKQYPDDQRSITRDYQLDIKTKFESNYEVESYRLHLGFFSRADQNDSNRNIINFDETYFSQNLPNFSYSVGSHIFNWSIMEVFRPIDTINAKNFDSNGDQIERLGQPSIILKKDFDESYFELILFLTAQKSIIPTSSNRNGAAISLSGNELTNIKEPRYVNSSSETSSNSKDIEYVIHYKHSFDNLELDIHFANKYDTNNPLFSISTPKNTSPTLNSLEVTPFFLKYNQYGIALQTNYSDYIFKIESTYNDYSDDTVELFLPPNFQTHISREDFSLSTFGLERSYSYSNGSNGVVFIEFQKVLNTSNEVARVLTPFQRDLAVFYRHSFNDFYSNQVILGFITDLDQGNERIYSISIERRLFQSWKAKVDIRVIEADSNPKNLDLTSFQGLKGIANSDSVALELVKFF